MKTLPGVELPGATAEQRVRLFLLVLVCRMIIPGKRSHVLARYLEPLRGLGSVSRLSWGSLAYIHLLYEMKNASRTTLVDPAAMAAFWRVLEVFTTPFDFDFVLEFDS